MHRSTCKWKLTCSTDFSSSPHFTTEHTQRWSGYSRPHSIPLNWKVYPHSAHNGWVYFLLVANTGKAHPQASVYFLHIAPLTHHSRMPARQNGVVQGKKRILHHLLKKIVICFLLLLCLWCNATKICSFIIIFLMIPVGKKAFSLFMFMHNILLFKNLQCKAYIL